MPFDAPAHYRISRILRGTIVAEQITATRCVWEILWHSLGCASLQAFDLVSQTIVDIPTAYCNDHRDMLPIAQFASRRRVRLAGGSGKWPT